MIPIAGVAAAAVTGFAAKENVVAALGSMNSEIIDRKRFQGGVILQFASGYGVAFLVYQIGTLISHLISMANRNLESEHARKK